jgi:hypothetical protein
MARDRTSPVEIAPTPTNPNPGQAHREQIPSDTRPTPRQTSPGWLLAAAGLTALQRRAGNQAVTGLVSVQRDGDPFSDDPLSAGGFSDADATIRVRPGPVRTTLIRPGPTTPGDSRVIGVPDPVNNVSLPTSDSDPRLGVDLAADARTVTVTFVARNVNFRDAGDAGRFDWLHEPSVAIQVTPGDTPQPVVQAAVAAMNAHLRRRGRDLVELSLSPQVAGGQSGVSAGVQAQAEIHVTASFSFTASSTVSVGPRSPNPDPSQIRLGGNRLVDVTWAPVSVGVLWHLDSGGTRRPQTEPPIDYAAQERDSRLITWVAGQLDPSWFNAPGVNDFDISEVVGRLLNVMRGASGERAELELHFGLMPIPAGFRTGMERAAQLIAGTNATFSNLRQVRVTIFGLQSDNTEAVLRYTILYLEGSAVTPPPVPPPPVTWGTGGPAR